MLQKSEILAINFLKSLLRQSFKASNLKRWLGEYHAYRIRILSLFLSLTSFCLGDTDLRNYTESNLPQHSNVRHLQWHGQSYWVKTADATKGWLSCTGKKIMSFLVPDKIIAPTPICNATILKVEARRLKECEQKQGSCTRLIMQGTDWILVSDAGNSFEYFLRSLPLDQRLPYIIKGLEAVLNLHTHHLVHGRASVKDLTLTSSHDFLFIDLAEDPESWMTWEEACTRDLINYFMTTVILLRPDKSLEHEYATIFIEKFPPELKPLLQRVIDNTEWLGKIAYAIRGFAGKDTVKFAHAHRLLRKRLKGEIRT
ncbi:MAG: hypothetical protein K0M45_02815 [Candidatus Paracaedibacteraceae bacterium]|nr:hypothetical protein [Candidatus Paracaedibacteraceae bacterium]